MSKHLIEIIEEQIAVGFTGKINVLSGTTKQLLGHLIFYEGDFIHITYRVARGLKALSSLVIDEIEHISLDFIVEPEIIAEQERSIFYPFSKLKEKLQTILTEYNEVKDQRPPDGIKLLVNSSILSADTELTEAEFSLLCTMSDVNKVEDIYKNSELLDYEITKSLVTLRKKNAIKVVGPSKNPGSI